MNVCITVYGKLLKRFAVSPVTSVPSKRVFSASGTVISEIKNRLKQKKIQYAIISSAKQTFIRLLTDSFV